MPKTPDLTLTGPLVAPVVNSRPAPGCKVALPAIWEEKVGWYFGVVHLTEDFTYSFEYRSGPMDKYSAQDLFTTWQNDYLFTVL